MPCSSNISEASGHDPEIKETLLTSPMQVILYSKVDYT